MDEPKKSFPPLQTKACPISRREMARLLHIEKKSLETVCGIVECSRSLLTTWLAMYQLDHKVFCDWQTIQDAYMVVENGKRTVKWVEENTVSKAEIVDDVTPNEGQKPERSEGQSLAIARPADAAKSDELTDDEKAWLALSAKQREVITLMASFEPEVLKMNDTQLAERVGIQRQTLSGYRQDPNFNTCLMERMEANFRILGKQVWFNDLMARYTADFDSLTKDDRALIARVLGLEKVGMTVNVMNYQAPSGLKNRY